MSSINLFRHFVHDDFFITNQKVFLVRFGGINFNFLKNSKVQIDSNLNEKNCMITYTYYVIEK